MAQKKGAVAKKANGVAKTPAKRQAKQETEEEVAAAAVQSPTKKGKKQPVKPVEPPISSDDEADGIQMDDGSDSENENEKAPIDSEAEEDSNAEEESDEGEAEGDQAEESSDDEEEDDEEADSEEEPGQVSLSKSQSEAAAEADSDEDDDEAPTEAPIAKKTAEEEGGIPKAKLRIPTDIPNDQVIHVSLLPPKYKHLDLLGVFTKFGPITAVERLKTKAGGNTVCLAFETAEAAAAAIAAKGKAVTLNDTVLKVSQRIDKESLNKRTVVISQIGKITTKEHLQGHFQKCGAIEAVTLSNNRLNPVGFVRFESADSVAKAQELNYTLLNGNHISVRPVDFKSPKAAKYTVAVRNDVNLGSYKPDELEKVLKKCGEIAELEVVCTRTVLAFVTFKTTEAAEKALLLNGKKAGELTLKLDPYEANTAARSIIVSNINTGVTEDEVKELFSQSGAISKVTWLNHKAIIKFETDDGFCKSFLLNETELKGQPIFLEPNSHIKLKWLNKRHGPHKSFGPPQHQGKFTGGPNKFGKKFGGPGGQHGQASNNFKNKNFNKGGPNKFNKRPAQDSGSTPHFYKRAKTN